MSDNQALVPVNRELTVAVSRQLSMVETIHGQSLVHNGAIPILVPQTGDRARIGAVTFSLDERFVFSGGRSGIYQWDLATGYCLKHVELESSFDGILSFSSDGQLALMWLNYTSILWDAISGKCINEFESDDQFSAAMILPDSKKILSGHGDGNLRLWDIASGECLKVMGGHTGSVYSIAISSDGRQALSGTYEDTFVLLWDLTTGQLLEKFQGYTGRVCTMAFLPDNRPALITVCEDKNQRFWDLSSDQCLWAREDSFRPVMFSPNGLDILYGSKMAHRGTEKEKELKLLDAVTGNYKQVLHGQFVWNTAAFTPDGTKILTGGRDATLSLWDVNSAHCSIMGNATHIARCISFSKDYIAFLGANETLWLWHVVLNNFLPCFRGFNDSRVTFSQDGQRLLSWGDDNNIKVWNIATGQNLHVLKGHSGRVFSANFSIDGRNVLSLSKDDTVRTWDINTGNCLETLLIEPAREQSESTMEDHFSFFDKPFAHSLISFAMLPSKNLIATSNGSPMKIWDVTNRQLLHVYDLSGNGIYFSPDGQQLLLIGRKNNKIMDVNTGHIIQTLEGPSLTVQNRSRFPSIMHLAAFSPNGNFVTAFVNDGSLRLWDASTGGCLHTLMVDGQDTEYVAFSPDGTLVIAGASDGALRLWDVDTGRFLASMTVFDDGSWYVLSPDGHYDSSDNGESDHLRWTVGMESHPVAYFKARFRVPRLLEKVMFREL